MKPVLGGAATSGVGLLGILKVNVKVGNWSTDLAKACWRASADVVLPRSTTLAKDLKVLTGRAPTSSFLTISSGVCFGFTVSVSGAFLDTSATGIGLGEDVAANETVGRAVFSGSAEEATVREIISKAENFDGGGCFGVVVCDAAEDEG